MITNSKALSSENFSENVDANNNSIKSLNVSLKGNQIKNEVIIATKEKTIPNENVTLIQMKKSNKSKKSQKSIVFLGDSSVGKTSIILRFVKKPIKNEHFETIGVNYYSWESETEYGDLEFSLWDTNGNELTERVLTSFVYKSANSFIIVCSYDKKSSLESIEKYFQLISGYKIHINTEAYNNYLIPIFIVVNKREIPPNERKFSVEKLREKINFNLNFKIIEVSAKENKGIDFLFLNVVVGMFGNYSDMSILNHTETDLTFDTMLNPKKRKFRILKRQEEKKIKDNNVSCC